MSQKERTTVERNIKQLLKATVDDLQNNNSGSINQTNEIRTSSSLTLDSPQDEPLANKSPISSFLNSISASTTKKRSMCAATNHTNSVAEEFLLYKSLALKEVQRMIKNDSNHDASDFW